MGITVFLTLFVGTVVRSPFVYLYFLETNTCMHLHIQISEHTFTNYLSYNYCLVKKSTSYIVFGMLF